MIYSESSDNTDLVILNIKQALFNLGVIIQ
jgi:hypothetical protein